MGNKRPPKIALKSTKNQLFLKQGWCKDNMACLNHWGFDENVTLQNINNIKISLHISLKRNCGVRKN